MWSGVPSQPAATQFELSTDQRPQATILSLFAINAASLSNPPINSAITFDSFSAPV